MLHESDDLTVRRFNIGNRPDCPAALCFLEGMTNKDRIGRDILEPLLKEHTSLEIDHARRADREVLDQLGSVLTSAELTTMHSLQQAVYMLLRGRTILLLDGLSSGMILSTEGWEKRNIEPPETEVSIRGSREGFTESVATTVAQIRRRLAHPDLVFERMELGRLSKTQIRIVHIEGIANPKLVDEVKRRLRRIEIDSIGESGYVEELIRDHPFSIFPTVSSCERPDRVASKLLEGRVGVILDGTPMVLTMPALFVEFFQYPDDYFFLAHFGTLIRLVRYISFAISIAAPAAYIAVTTYHQELLPTPLLFTMAAAREGTPFPVLLEALLMGLIFEMLQEAGTRLPRPIGQTVSIVGAPVIGDAAIRSGLIGAPMVMVIAITAIASFVVPALTEIQAPLRLFLALLAGVIGAMGFGLGLLVILIHLASLRSFGVPYLSPLAPLIPADLKDTVVRAPWWSMHRRPHLLVEGNRVRQGSCLRPGPGQPQRGEEGERQQ